MSKITVKNIEKSFGKGKVLDNIDFEVDDGKVVSLLGPSGCGKTTTLKVIAGLLQPDDGDYFYRRPKHYEVATGKKRDCHCFSGSSSFSAFKCGAKHWIWPQDGKASKKGNKGKVEEMLDLVKLKGYESQVPS